MRWLEVCNRLGSLIPKKCMDPGWIDMGKRDLLLPMDPVGRKVDKSPTKMGFALDKLRWMRHM